MTDWDQIFSAENQLTTSSVSICDDLLVRHEAVATSRLGLANFSAESVAALRSERRYGAQLDLACRDSLPKTLALLSSPCEAMQAPSMLSQPLQNCLDAWNNSDCILSREVCPGLPP